MWAVSTRMDPARDVTIVENTPIDYLDFASPESGLGSKIGLDATDKWPPETRREWGRLLRSEEHTSELQSLMRISYAVFCLQKKTNHIATTDKTKKSKNTIQPIT